MGIIIEDMEMPKNCKYCYFSDLDEPGFSHCCHLYHRDINYLDYGKRRAVFCQLKEINTNDNKKEGF